MLDINNCRTNAMFLASESYSGTSYDMVMTAICDGDDEALITQRAA